MLWLWLQASCVYTKNTEAGVFLARMEVGLLCLLCASELEMVGVME